MGARPSCGAVGLGWSCTGGDPAGASPRGPRLGRRPEDGGGGGAAGLDYTLGQSEGPGGNSGLGLWGLAC